MIMLMGTILLGVLVVGTAALTGHPLLIAVGGILAAAILVASRQGRDRRTGTVPSYPPTSPEATCTRRR
jgi:hypothetical protein